MGEFGRTSLLMLAASIGQSDPWVMGASAGAVTLTPLRMMSAEERRSARDEAVLLWLSDLGHLISDDAHGSASASPMRGQAEVVLLLSWSMLPTIAELDALARRSAREISPRYAPEDWLPTWHHFVDGDDNGPEASVAAGQLTALQDLPFVGLRHYVLGSLATATSSVEFGFTPVSHRSGERASSTVQVPAALVEPQVDALSFTNPGSSPEGLSPLFARHRD